MARALVVGEVLWDRFPDSARLGGAPLNFAVHFQRLGHTPMLVSAVGADGPGDEAKLAIQRFGLDTTFLQSTVRFNTGSATIRVGPAGQPAFTIVRPAAYDAVALSDAEFEQISASNPSWVYYGTLFPHGPDGRRTLDRLLAQLPDATRFYDLNLRPGVDDPALVADLLRAAHVVKLNDEEMMFVSRLTGLPADRGGFCREGRRRYGWRAVAVTLGERGCAMIVGDDYVEAGGIAVEVVDTVGAGDAFAAAFVHGLASGWTAATIADAANRAGAAMAAIEGAMPVR